MRLTQATNEALELLAKDGKEVAINLYSRPIWLGVGYCVAKGWAVYHGEDMYMVTDAGLKAYAKTKDKV